MMWIQAGALPPVPSYAVVAQDEVTTVLLRLTADEALQERLTVAFRLLEREQPALSGFLSSELATLEHQAAQALLFFLFLTVFLAFRQAFGDRLGPIAADDLDAALERLVVDGEVRSQACQAESYSEDMIAFGQPALMRLVHSEVDQAPEEVGDVSPVLQAALVEILALTHAVVPIC